MWFVGIILSTLATAVGTLGKLLMKYSHQIAAEAWKSRVVFYFALLCVVLFNPLLDLSAYAFAAQSMLAPLAGLSVVWNVTLAPLVVKEEVFLHDYVATFLILLGIVGVGISGSKRETSYSIDELKEMFARPNFIVYAVCFASWMVALGLLARLTRNKVVRRFCWGAASGSLGGNQFLVKSVTELVKSGGENWKHFETYGIILAAIAVAATGLWLLNQGLKRYTALFVVTMYQSFFIISGCLSGVAFFNEMASTPDNPISKGQQALYGVSIVVVIAGICVLSLRPTSQEDEGVAKKDGTKQEKAAAGGKGGETIEIRSLPDETANGSTVISVSV